MALLGWKDFSKSLDKNTCKKWITWDRVLRHWRLAQQMTLMNKFRASMKLCIHEAYKMELTHMYKTLFKDNIATKGKNYVILCSLAAMVYAEVFLNRKVDWNVINMKL